MASKTIYQLDEDGFYVDEAIADESPMQPGFFLIPRLCVEFAPPAHIEGKRRRVVDGVWGYVDVPPESDQPEEKTPEELWTEYRFQAYSALAKSDITVLRCMESGVTVPLVWVEYRQSLRAIVGAETGDYTQLFPTRPDYPLGT